LFKSILSQIKKGFVYIAQSRLLLVAVVTCLLFALLIQQLFYLQIVQGQHYLDNFRLQIRRERELTGTRGGIYDRNGNPLAYNELANSVVIEENIQGTQDQTRNEILNDIIIDVINIVEANGDSVVSDFGITLDATGNFTFAMTDEFNRLRFLADVYGHRTIDEMPFEQVNAIPQDVIDFLATDPATGFDINLEDKDNDLILKMVGLRYAIRLNGFTQYIPTILAQDVSDETAAAIMENQYRLHGVSIIEDYMRRYVDSLYFSSIIGYTGKISLEEFELLNAEGEGRFSLTDIIGKAGIEQSMEETLRGRRGFMTFYVDNFGRVTEKVGQVEPTAGNNVYLTICRELQIHTYRILEEKLAGIILSRLTNQMNYVPDPYTDTSYILIPIDLVYLNFITNGILNHHVFNRPDAGAAERAIHNAFIVRRQSQLAEISTYLGNPNGHTYNELSGNMQDTIDHIFGHLLAHTFHVIDRSQISPTDPVEVSWRRGELNAFDYLNNAIAENWIDTTRLSAHVNLDRYAEATQVFNAIIELVENALRQDLNFDRIIYLDLIRSGTITGGQVFAAVYEQGVLEMEMDTYQGLLAGAIDPFIWVFGMIESLTFTPGQLGLEPSTGGIVVSDPTTGEVLASVSYPGYDNNRLANELDVEYYDFLLHSLAKPFYNNATQELTAPGSTFKMVTALAGLNQGLIHGGTSIVCLGEFEPVEPPPRCWIYPGEHGGLNVVNSLAESCNVFYYQVGYDLSIGGDRRFHSELGLNQLAHYAGYFGLDQVSGMEIPEARPRVSDELPILSAIGQGTNNFTVAQLNRYVSTIANNGTLLELTLLSRTTDMNGMLINEYTPVIQRELTHVNPHHFYLLRQGMVGMVNNHLSFRDFHFPMAGKTGTAQQSDINADHALFVGFAPLDQPEIAVAVRIVNGYTSAYAAEIGRDIVRVWFELDNIDDVITGRANLIPPPTEPSE
jgi:penicillin-binding protein 2